MIGERIRRKRLAARMSLQDLADRLKALDVSLTRAALSSYETGRTAPSAKTLWAIARALDESLDYFVKEESVSLNLHGFRKKAAATRGEVDSVRARVHDEVEKHLSLDRLLGDQASPAQIPRRLVRSVDDAEELAKEVRKKWGLGSEPIASVTTLLEDRGWYVIAIPDDPHVDGLAGVVEGTGRPFAVSRKVKATDRVRINLLHEAAHALLSNDDLKLEERCAFRFAAALLLPASRVYAEIGKRRASLDFDELLFVKKKYGLSIQAITMRLHDLGVITDSYKTLLFTFYSKNGFRIDEPGSDDLQFQEKPMALRRKVHRALAEGLVSEAEALRILPGLRLRDEAAFSISSASIKELMHKSKKERDEVLRMAADAAASDYNDPDLNLSDRSEPYVDDSTEG
ncbi:MAG TPA: XRE family transcriptional regulator [Spirochaetia bacterium]|nr:XRE family transcriptional regulator [Spirochaetia bacterium]